MAYDNSRESVILFGGNNFEWDERNSSNAIISGGIFGDTWELTGSNWQKLASDGPSARFSSTMVFDSHRNKMILFGGVKGEKYGWGKEDYLSDTWELEDGLWKKAAIKGPSARNAPAMVFDVNLKRVMLFGGLNNFDRKISNEVWSWDGILWKKKTIAKSPMNIVADSIHYDRYSGHTFGVLNSWVLIKFDSLLRPLPPHNLRFHRLRWRWQSRSIYLRCQRRRVDLQRYRFCEIRQIP